MNVLRREILQSLDRCRSLRKRRNRSAQNYPTCLTMIVPFAAGGTTDVTARIVGEHMSRTLGQQIIVENIVGAGGTVGSTRAMRANPDGYTIEMGQMGTHAAAVALYPNLAYKPDVDFEPIGMVSAIPALIVARKDFPPKDLKEFVSFVKANGDKLNVAHSGVGSVFFTTCMLLNSILNVKPTLVPFNGGSPAMNALVGGQVDPGGARTGERVHSQLQAGTIKAFAVGSGVHSDAAERADIKRSRPTGIPGISLERLVAPSGAQAGPRRLAGALDKALDDANTRKRPGIGQRHSRPRRAAAPAARCIG
jgi:tripartite-type tricarboxylate transporter receptor subunit TctC